MALNPVASLNLETAVVSSQTPAFDKLRANGVWDESTAAGLKAAGAMDRETPLLFACQGETLLGVLHTAETATELGVVIVVGGPQYRAGSGRQYVLLARRLAAVGFPVLRFDVRGMGDSTGEPRGFQALDADIRAALDCFFAHAPGLRRVGLWGLCGAAAAVLFYAHQDSRVQGLVLLNPWVYSQQGAAKTRLKHYYRQRLCSPDLWRKLLSFRFDFADSWQSWLGFLKQATAKTARDAVAVEPPLADRLRACLARFQQPVLLILSGRDLTASEFKDVVQADAGWRGLLNRPDVTRLELAAADHTFSSALWRDQVAAWTVGWLKALG